MLGAWSITHDSAPQLFDENNYINRNPMKYLFTTEGHLLPLRTKHLRKPWDPPEPAPHSNVSATVSEVGKGWCRGSQSAWRCRDILAIAMSEHSAAHW